MEGVAQRWEESAFQIRIGKGTRYRSLTYVVVGMLVVTHNAFSDRVATLFSQWGNGYDLCTVLKGSLGLRW